MKSVLTLAAWLFVSVVIVYAAANPESGVIFQSPMAALGVGLIGLGLCKQTRDHLKAEPLRENA